MKIRLALEIEDRKGHKLNEEAWEELRTEMSSAAASVLCDACGGDSGDVDLVLEGILPATVQPSDPRHGNAGSGWCKCGRRLATCMSDR